MKYQRGGISESSTTSDNTSQFIDIVKKHDVVYNTHHPDYKNVEVKLKVWSQIATEIDLSVDASKRKWKNLRDSYTKYLRSFRVGTKTSKKYQYWAHAEHMEFLKPYQGPGRSNTTTAVTIPRATDEDDNECDLGYQVLTKATSSSTEEDVKVPPPTLPNVVSGIGVGGVGVVNNSSNSNSTITGISLNSSVACITPQLPSVLNTGASIGLVSSNNNTSTTMAGGLVLPVPSLPMVQLPPSLLAMPKIGLNSNTTNHNTTTYTSSSCVAAPSINATQLFANLSAMSNKPTSIPMPSSTAASSVGCLIIEPQLFASTDNFKKELNSSVNNGYITTNNLNQYAQLHATNSSGSTTTTTRFNPALITKIRRVQPSPQTSAINLSFSTIGSNNNNNNNNNNAGSSTTFQASTTNGISYYATPTLTTSTSTATTTPSPAKIRKTFDPDISAILQANRDLDANTLFFLSLSKQVRAMPTKFQSLAKMRCMRIISDLELELDNVAGDGITSYTYNNGATKYCNLDSPTDAVPPPSQVNANNHNNNIIGESQPEHFVYVMSPSRVEGMIDLSSDEENNANGN